MGVFWNKTSEKNKIIYTRSKRQKRLAYIIMFVGFFLIIGPPLLAKFQFFAQLFNSITILGGKWPLYVFVSGGLIVIVDALFVSYINFILAFAKLRNKKFEITTNSSSGDKVIIEK